MEHVGRTSRVVICFVEFRMEREKGGIDVESFDTVRRLVACPDNALILPAVENAALGSSLVPVGGAAMECRYRGRSAVLLPSSRYRILSPERCGFFGGGGGPVLPLRPNPNPVGPSAAIECRHSDLTAALCWQSDLAGSLPLRVPNCGFPCIMSSPSTSPLISRSTAGSSIAIGDDMVASEGRRDVCCDAADRNVDDFLLDANNPLRTGSPHELILPMLSGTDELPRSARTRFSTEARGDSGRAIPLADPV